MIRSFKPLNELKHVNVKTVKKMGGKIMLALTTIVCTIAPLRVARALYDDVQLIVSAWFSVVIVRVTLAMTCFVGVAPS